MSAFTPRAGRQAVCNAHLLLVLTSLPLSLSLSSQLSCSGYLASHWHTLATRASLVALRAGLFLDLKKCMNCNDASCSPPFDASLSLWLSLARAAPLISHHRSSHTTHFSLPALAPGHTFGSRYSSVVPPRPLLVVQWHHGMAPPPNTLVKLLLPLGISLTMLAP